MSDEIVEKLKRLKPRVESSEADLLYQIGWQAALASSERAASNIQPRPAWTNYLFGAVSGLAASALFVVLFDQNQFNQDARQSEPDTVASSFSQEKATSGADSFDPTVLTTNRKSKLDVSSSLDRLANTTLSPVARESWRSLLEERSRVTHSSQAEPSEFLNRESLQSILNSFPGT